MGTCWNRVNCRRRTSLTNNRQINQLPRGDRSPRIFLCADRLEGRKPQRSTADGRLVAEAARTIRPVAEAFASLHLIHLIVPLEPDDGAVSLERQDVRRDAIEKPAIV